MSTSDEFPEADVLDHAWKWFSMHASQRMQVFNYYIVSAAFITAGYVTAETNDRGTIAGFVAVGGILVTVSFWLLQNRTRQLTDYAIEAIIACEQVLATRAGIDSVKIAQSSRMRTSFFSYHVIMTSLSIVSFILFLLGALLAFGIV